MLVWGHLKNNNSLLPVHRHCTGHVLHTMSSRNVTLALQGEFQVSRFVNERAWTHLKTKEHQCMRHVCRYPSYLTLLVLVLIGVLPLALSPQLLQVWLWPLKRIMLHLVLHLVPLKRGLEWRNDTCECWNTRIIIRYQNMLWYFTSLGQSWFYLNAVAILLFNK